MVNYYSQFATEYAFPSTEAAAFFADLVEFVPAVMDAANNIPSLKYDDCVTAIQERLALSTNGGALSTNSADAVVEFVKDNWDALVDFPAPTDEHDVDGNKVFVSNGIGSGSDAFVLAHMLQCTQKKFDIKTPYSIEYADICDRQRSDSFGGGAIVVTQDDITGMHTSAWVADTIEDLVNPKPETKPDILFSLDGSDKRCFSNDPSQIGKVLVWDAPLVGPPFPQEYEPIKLEGTAEEWQLELSNAVREHKEFNYSVFLTNFIKNNS